MSVLIETLEDGVLTLAINRPEARNAINTPVTMGMIDAIKRSENNPDVRCIVITGNGGLFSAGGDLNEQASGSHLSSDNGEDPEAALEKQIREASVLSRLLHETPKPTLAIIPGAAAGAGFAITLSCDMRFCLDTAKLTTAFIKVGLGGDCGGSYFLPQLVGAAKAKELYFFGDVFTGQDAYEMGLVTKVANKENFEEESRAFAKRLASLPTQAIGCIKQNMNAGFSDSNMEKVFELEARNIVRCMKTEDHKAAVQAFVKKEVPTFTGR